MSTYQKLAAMMKQKGAREMVRRYVIDRGMVGTKAADIYKDLGLCRETVGVHLRSLEESGLVERTILRGPNLLWGPVGIKGKYVSEKKPWPSIRERSAREKERRQLMSLGDDVELLPVRRFIVPAEQAQPLVKPGVCSVWELAA